MENSEKKLVDELVKAIESRDLKAVKRAVSKGADIHASVTKQIGNLGNIKLVTKYPNYPLKLAAAHGFLDAVKYLVSKGADINKDDDPGVMTSAVWNDQFETAEWLLENGGNPNAKDNNGCILQWLIDKNQLYLAAKAVSYGADTSILSPEDKKKLDEFLSCKKMVKAKKL